MTAEQKTAPVAALGKVPEYFYRCCHPFVGELPGCFYERPVLYDATEPDRWREAVNYLYSVHGLRPWDQMDETILLNLHHLLTRDTRRYGLIVAGSGWRQERGIVFRHDMRSFFLDREKWSCVWSEDDRKQWDGIVNKCNAYLARYPSCDSPLDNIVDQNKLTDAEWSALRKIALVAPPAREVLYRLKCFWALMVKRVESSNLPQLLAWIHQQLTWIHPMRFGVGRLARLWCSFVAMRRGLGPLPFSISAKYMNAVIQSDQDLGPLTQYMAGQIQEVSSTLTKGLGFRDPGQQAQMLEWSKKEEHDKK